MTKISELYQIADELRALASLGLYYSQNGYDKERYEKVLHTSARMVAALDHGEAEPILAQYRENLAHMSPLLCVEAVVLREGKILLIQRRDDQHWALPGGLAEVGETPAQAAERELWEEAGLHGQAERLLGLLDTRYWNTRSRMHLCTSIFQISSQDEPAACSVNAGEVSPFAETLDIGFFAEDALPPLSQGHDVRVPLVFRLLRGEVPVPYFDVTHAAEDDPQR